MSTFGELKVATGGEERTTAGVDCRFGHLDWERRAPIAKNHTSFVTSDVQKITIIYNGYV